jgi:undecaprenyldiphospho-muramoylpentapeptide beta-N-acetylglucosaminyltransferase
VDPWIVIAGGGTAGHLVPGLVVADELVARGHERGAIHFVGSERGPEATMVPERGYGVTLLGGRGIERKLSVQNIKSAWGLLMALFSAIALLRSNRPKVVLTLGGYASLACGIGAVVLRIPLVVAEQNARAGLANRLVGRMAKACAVPFEGTDLPRSVVTGNPVRPEIFAAADLGDAEAASMMGLPSDRIRLVVFTGSLGSRKVNEAIVELAGRWRHRSDLAIHHVVGRRDFGDLPLPSSLDSVATGDPDTMQWGGDETIWYRQVAYEDRMGPALAAADVVVSRAGGSTVAELAVVGVPAVLVPLPIATRNHQQFNAGDLVRAGGAVLIIDAALSADSLEGALLPLLDDEAARERMAEAARSVGRPEAAALVADLVEEHASAR